MPRSSSRARRKVTAENLPDWSMRTWRPSFLVTFSSIQLPRSGMIQQECRARSVVEVSSRKSTPGDRCSWLTITRSEPLTMNSPPPSMIGISPR